MLSKVKVLEFLTAVVLLCTFNNSNSQDLSYLKGMPSPRKVKEKIIAADIKNTYIKQSAALHMLILMIEDRKFTKSGSYSLSSPETSLIHQYQHAMDDVMSDYNKNVASLTVPKNNNEFTRLINLYPDEDSLRYEIVYNLFSKNTRDIYLRKEAMENEKKEVKSRHESIVRTGIEQTKVEKEERKRFVNKFGYAALLFISLAIFCFARAFFLASELNRYEFEHRTSGGVVEFKSYEEAKIHGRKKGVSRVLYQAGLITMVISILLATCWVAGQHLS